MLYNEVFFKKCKAGFTKAEFYLALLKHNPTTRKIISVIDGVNMRVMYKDLV